MAVNRLGDMYLLDDENYWLVYLPGDDSNPRIAGGWGEIGENFSLPTDLITSPDFEVYLCDNETHRILRFDRKLNFLGVLNTQALMPDPIYFPNHIVVNRLGELFISSDQDRIIYFISTDRKMINQIGHTSYGQDRFGDIFQITLGNQSSIGIVDIGNGMFYWINRMGKILNKKKLPENLCYLQPWREDWLILGESGKLYFYDVISENYSVIDSYENVQLSISPSDFDILNDTLFVVDNSDGKVYRSIIKFIE